MYDKYLFLNLLSESSRKKGGRTLERWLSFVYEYQNNKYSYFDRQLCVLSTEISVAKGALTLVAAATLGSYHVALLVPWLVHQITLPLIYTHILSISLINIFLLLRRLDHK